MSAEPRSAILLTFVKLQLQKSPFRGMSFDLTGTDTLPIVGATIMSMWERKRVGEVVHALEIFSQAIRESSMKAQLCELHDHALNVERLPIVSSSALEQIQGDLCRFCKGHHILECSKVDLLSRCDFLSFAYVDSRFTPQ